MQATGVMSMGDIYDRTISEACNTDCVQYRQGTCPYRYDRKQECARFRVLYEIEAAPPEESEESF